MDNYSINVWKILGILFENPSTEFYIRELARKAGLNPNTVINVIKILEKKEFIKKKVKKHVVEISLNFENKEVIWQKRIFNIRRIYDSGIVDFLIKEYGPSLVSLIGSYSKGEDIERGDVDIVILSTNKKGVDTTKFEKILGKKIHLLIAQREKISEEFFNNLINGIILYGYIRK